MGKLSGDSGIWYDHRYNAIQKWGMSVETYRQTLGI